MRPAPGTRRPTAATCTPYIPVGSLGYEALPDVIRVKLLLQGRVVLVDLQGSYDEGTFHFKITGVADPVKGQFNQKNAQAAPPELKDLLKASVSMDQL